MTQEELRKQVELATKLVESQPAWKRDILWKSGQSTLTTPRKPFDNRRH